jgi:hypothetical protein
MILQLVFYVVSMYITNTKSLNKKGVSQSYLLILYDCYSIFEFVCVRMCMCVYRMCAEFRAQARGVRARLQI